MGSLSSDVICFHQHSVAPAIPEDASQNMSSAGRGTRRRGRTNVEEEEESLRKDALFLASTMAGVDHDNRSISPSHIAEEAVSGYEYNQQGAASIQTSFGSGQSEPHNSSLLLNSPMVTPPARIYTTAATTKAAKPKQRAQYAGVPHVYHDYSQVPDLPDYSRKKTGGVSQPFPEKLHEMLKIVEGTPDYDIVSWLSHGRAFLVKSPKQFTERIMPLHFKQTKLTSFQRQLNLYGFRRLTQGTDAGAYYHEKFLRARPALCQQMVRQKVKGTGHKQPADAKTEPNFYLMPPVGDPAPPGQGLYHSMEPQVHYTSAAVDPTEDTTEEDTQAEEESVAAAPQAASYFSSSSRNMYSRLPPVTLETMSPMSPGMRGAAHLLQGIAAGHAGTLSMPMESTTSSDNKQKSEDEADTPSTSFLQPRISSSRNFHVNHEKSKNDEEAL